MKKRVAIIIILSLFLVTGVYYFLKNSGKSAKNGQSDKLQVSASFYPLYFFAKEIAGNKAEVWNIVPAGAEPHDYEPTARDVARMENSRLIVLNGAGLEPWMDSLQKNIDGERTEIIVAGEGLATQQIEEGGKKEADPHAWLSPKLAQKMVDRIGQGFQEADPANQAYYRANADNLKSRLNDLDLEYRKSLGSCSEKNIITSHNAFNYVADTYGFHQISISGLSPDAEPSPKELADISRFAKENDIKYIFFESLASSKFAETVAMEIGAKTLVLDPIEGLGPEEAAAGKNYFTLMQDNLKNLRIALQCQ